MVSPGRHIGLYQMAPIFCGAYDVTFTRKNILKGFEAAGISPLNRDILDDEDFAPKAVFVSVVAPGPSDGRSRRGLGRAPRPCFSRLLPPCPSRLTEARSPSDHFCRCASAFEKPVGRKGVLKS